MPADDERAARRPSISGYLGGNQDGDEEGALPWRPLLLVVQSFFGENVKA